MPIERAQLGRPELTARGARERKPRQFGCDRGADRRIEPARARRRAFQIATILCASAIAWRSASAQPRTAKGRERAQKAVAPSRDSGPLRRTTALCRVPVLGSGPSNPDLDIWLKVRRAGHGLSTSAFEGAALYFISPPSIASIARSIAAAAVRRGAEVVSNSRRWPRTPIHAPFAFRISAIQRSGPCSNARIWKPLYENTRSMPAGYAP